jgi:large conductance mechanosensitive channel
MDIPALIKDTANDFKAFILKGNVVDLAVGVVIGGAFGEVVKAAVGGIINPVILLFGIKTAEALTFADFFKAVITFLAIAAVVFFLIVKPMNMLMALAKRKAEQNPAEAPPLPEDVKLLMEIRDLLKAQRHPSSPPPLS